LEAIGQKKQADAIRNKATLPVSDKAIYERATRSSAPIATVHLDAELAQEVGIDWKLSGAAALMIEEINENIRNARIIGNRLMAG